MHLTLILSLVHECYKHLNREKDSVGVTSMATRVKIADILSSQYSDFIEYCQNAGKEFRDELTSVDFVAYRSQSGTSRERISQLRELLYSFHATSDTDCDEALNADDETELTTEFSVPSDKQNRGIPEQESDVTSAESITIEEITEPISILGSDDIIQGRNESAQDDYVDPLAFESEIPLYISFNTDWMLYANTPITAEDFSVRVFNSLRRGYKINGEVTCCTTVGELLQLCPLQLMNYRQMGKQSYEVVLAVLPRLIERNSDNAGKAEEKTKPAISDNVKTQIVAMLHNESFETATLNEQEIEVLTYYQGASETIGKDIALYCLNNEQAVCDLIEMFRDFYTKRLNTLEMKNELGETVSFISEEVLSLPVIPFLVAYRISKNVELCFPTDTTMSVSDYFRTAIDASPDFESVYNSTLAYAKWLNFDVSVLYKPLLDAYSNLRENYQVAFDCRLRGETLEVAGKCLGVTRERVRQMETKVARTLALVYQRQSGKYDCIAMTFALRGGDSVLCYDEVASVLGEQGACLIWYMAKKGDLDCASYHYSEQLDAVVLGKEEDCSVVNTLVDELPPYIESKELSQFVSDIVEKHSVSRELVLMRINAVYKCDGSFYHRSRLTVLFMCGYILKTRFPNGYKVADDTDQLRFMTYLRELFAAKGQMTARAIDAKIGEVGVLFDRGKYIHPSLITIDKALIDEVISYISNSPRIVLTYTELFSTFEKRFAGTQINNRYILQGALKLYGCPFVMRKDYITKESDTNLAAEFEHFVEQHGKVHKSVILDEFRGLSDINIGFFCQRLPSIVVLDGGYYMHASLLSISEDDYRDQRKYLLTTCSSTPVSTRLLYNEYMLKFTDFMIRNDIETQGYLFGVLQYMFRKEFFFSRPYISLTNDLELTNRGVLLQHLLDVDTIDIDDLVDMCEENGIHYLSVRSLLDSITPDYVRIDKTKLMKKELVGIDDDIVVETAQQIQEIVRVHGGYYASKNIDDFGWFPELNVPWNAFLVESIAAMAGNLLGVLHMNTSTVFVPTDVYVGDEYSEEDINSLIIALLAKESQIEPFASKDDVFVWLQEQGLCNAKLPSFLESASLLITDEYGRITVNRQ